MKVSTTYQRFIALKHVKESREEEEEEEEEEEKKLEPYFTFAAMFDGTDSGSCMVGHTTTTTTTTTT